MLRSHNKVLTISFFLTINEYVFKTGDSLSGFQGRFKILTTALPTFSCPEILTKKGFFDEMHSVTPVMTTDTNL